MFYCVDSDGGQFLSINPNTGTVTRIGSVPGGTVEFGSIYSSSTGEVYGFNNLGGFYQFNLTTDQRTLVSSAPPSSANDGAHCVKAPILFSADLAVTKADGVATYSSGTK